MGGSLGGWAGGGAVEALRGTISKMSCISHLAVQNARSPLNYQPNFCVNKEVTECKLVWGKIPCSSAVGAASQGIQEAPPVLPISSSDGLIVSG